MTYCDSSFLISLYVSTDRFHKQAYKEASKFSEPIPYTLLCELELLNTLRRALGNKSLNHASYDAIIRQIAVDEAEGLLEKTSINQIKMFEKAREFSKKYTSTLASRSLDILHVASATILAAKQFHSFDLRQRQLAESVGLKVKPSKASLDLTKASN